MGNILKILAHRIFQYPIKTPPICFYRQEDFTSSGVPIETEDPDKNVDIEESVSSSHHAKAEIKNTIEISESPAGSYKSKKQRKSSDLTDPSTSSSLRKAAEKFPGWDDHTIMFLHNMFLLFDDKKKAMLSPEDFCAILECLGEESSFEYRVSKFQDADVNGDNWLSYEEFLPALYNFNPPENGDLGTLAKLCFEGSENVKFVKSMTIGEQLEYGLF